MKTKRSANRHVKPRQRKLSSAKANGRRGVRHRNLPEYSEDGVDLSLIRWMLSLTPAQRLEVLQQSVRSLEDMRNASRGR